MLQPQFFFLSPVQVVKVTPENLQEAAEWCGGTVLETDSRRRPGTMDSYVLVPTPEGSNISWAFPGMYITQRLVITGKGEMKKSWAVFKKDYFEKNYFDDPSSAVEKTWEAERTRRQRQEVEVKVNVGEAVKAAVAKIHAAVEKAAEQAGLDEEQTKALAEAVMPDGVEKLTGVEFAGETEVVIGVETPVAWPLLVHNHPLAHGCDGSECVIDRYLDGDHFFTDKKVIARPEQESVVTDLTEAELDILTSLSNPG